MNKSMITLLFITAILFSSIITSATPDETKATLNTNQTDKNNRSWQKLGEIKTNYKNGPAYDPHVALDPVGNAIVVWHQYDKPIISEGGQSVGYWASRFTPQKGWDKAVKINTDEYPDNLSVLMDHAGNAVATWKDDEIWANTYTVNKGWGKAQRIKNSSRLVSFDFVMNNSGQGIMIWDGYLSGIWVAHYDSEKGWGDSKNLYKNKTLFAEPRVAINKSGNALITWAGYIGKAMASPRDLMTSYYSPKTGWSDAEKFKIREVSSVVPTIDSSGNGHIVWNEKKQGDFNRLSSRYMQGKGWSKEQKINNTGSSQYTNNHLSTDASGNTIAVWSQKIKKCHCLWVNYFTEKEGWGKAQRIDKESGSEPIKRLRLSTAAGSGNVIAIWQQSDDIWATHLSPINKKSVTYKLNNQAKLGISGNPISDISMTSDGNAIAVWGQQKGKTVVTKFRQFK